MPNTAGGLCEAWCEVAASVLTSSDLAACVSTPKRACSIAIISMTTSAGIRCGAATQDMAGVETP